MCNPYRHLLPPMEFEDRLRPLMKEMIAAFIPDDMDDSEALREAANDEFSDFWTHAGRFVNCWDEPVPPPLTSIEKEAKRTAMTLEDVSKFAESKGGRNSQLRWFEMYARDTTLYKLIAKPLLSGSSNGSMDIERYAKPLKYSIQTKQRNNLSDEYASILLRILINLRNVEAAVEALPK